MAGSQKILLNKPQRGKISLNTRRLLSSPDCIVML